MAYRDYTYRGSNGNRITVTAQSRSDADQMAPEYTSNPVFLYEGPVDSGPWDYESEESEPWHTPAICGHLAESFSVDEIVELEAEINRFFQRFFSFGKSEKTPAPQELVSQYFEIRVSTVRKGDPSGILGKVFKKVRGFYHSLEGSRISEILLPWAAFDWIVLSSSKSEVASRYRDALWVHYRDLLRTYFSKR